MGSRGKEDWDDGTCGDRNIHLYFIPGVFICAQERSIEMDVEAPSPPSGRIKRFK